ncbi:MAG TPA: OsmC family protein [Thermoleophilia bacterium]
MPTELVIHAVNRGGMVVTAGDGRHTVTMDYPLPGAESEELAGLKPLRMLLASLAACSGNSVAVLLRKMRQPLEAVEVEARGTRRDEHPTVITDIALDFTIRGSGVEPAAVEKALAISEAQVCPVWAMLKGATPITATYKVEAD